MNHPLPVPVLSDADAAFFFSVELKISLISTGCDDAESQRQPKTQCQKAQNSIKVNGEELSLNGKGVNVVAINRINGHVLHRKRFDTSKSDAESVKMASFITSLPKTSVVVGVVKNNAYGHFHSNRGLTNAMVNMFTQSIIDRL